MLFEKMEERISQIIPHLETFDGKWYESVFYNKNIPVFGLDGTNLYYNKKYFEKELFLKSLGEKEFNKILGMWFEKNSGRKIKWVGWSESLEKKLNK